MVNYFGGAPWEAVWSSFSEDMTDMGTCGDSQITPTHPHLHKVSKNHLKSNQITYSSSIQGMQINLHSYRNGHHAKNSNTIIFLVLILNSSTLLILCTGEKLHSHINYQIFNIFLQNSNFFINFRRIKCLINEILN